MAVQRNDSDLSSSTDGFAGFTPIHDNEKKTMMESDDEFYGFPTIHDNESKAVVESDDELVGFSTIHDNENETMIESDDEFVGFPTIDDRKNAIIYLCDVMESMTDGPVFKTRLAAKDVFYEIFTTQDNRLINSCRDFIHEHKGLIKRYNVLREQKNGILEDNQFMVRYIQKIKQDEIRLLKDLQHERNKNNRLKKLLECERCKEDHQTKTKKANESVNISRADNSLLI